jgi:anthranilate phosphoribosyltransferase
VNLDLGPEQVAQCVNEVGVGFMFAPRHHAAMKHAIGPRRQIGVRTVFNVLGPLTNPAGASRQLLGVYAAPLTERLAGVLRELGSERALVVHGSDGLDEITLTGPSDISELDRGRITSYRLEPQDLGLAPVPAESLKGGDAAHNAGILRRILDGERGAPRDVVLLNAAAAILVAGLADSLPAGLEQARDALDSGRARAALDALVQVSNN